MLDNETREVEIYKFLGRTDACTANLRTKLISKTKTAIDKKKKMYSILSTYFFKRNYRLYGLVSKETIHLDRGANVTFLETRFTTVDYVSPVPVE